ncbi:hypothetical protein NPIL_91701 [Nephila pilipes]|uniref:Secreted protein n=1 Tax=Nephila pilipes TaxID=299642 RepID=A0A8X6TRN6_NEPPI|nr:hypothetical protein NPIL_91701 [Nephila pilipes]
MTSSLRSRNISKLHSLIILLMTSLIGEGEGSWQDGIQPLIRISQLGKSRFQFCATCVTYIPCLKNKEQLKGVRHGPYILFPILPRGLFA